MSSKGGSFSRVAETTTGSRLQDRGFHKQSEPEDSSLRLPAQSPLLNQRWKGERRRDHVETIETCIRGFFLEPSSLVTLLRILLAESPALPKASSISDSFANTLLKTNILLFEIECSVLSTC